MMGHKTQLTGGISIHSKGVKISSGQNSADQSNSWIRLVIPVLLLLQSLKEVCFMPDQLILQVTW